jgi:glycine oxidase
MQDVLVVGGGVIGLSAAYELALHGVQVTVVDQGPIGREASWAGAGMLPPGDPTGPEPARRLAEFSFSLWPKLSADLKSETGIDNGFLRSGSIQIPFSSERDIASECALWQRIGVEAERLDGSGLREREPAIHPELVDGFRLPTMAQVRNPWHLKALKAACLSRGVRLLPGQPVVGWQTDQGRILAARTPTETVPAGDFLVTAGAWSSPLLHTAGVHAEIEPIRGQIVLLQTDRPPFAHIIESGRRYLVPRGDGRILIGSTEERAGFVKQNTAAGVQDLLRFACRIVPSLESARFEQAWSGLRPHARRGVPFLGRAGEAENLHVAAGHFRSGLSNSPGTARLIRQLITGEAPAIPVDGFRP